MIRKGEPSYRMMILLVTFKDTKSIQPELEHAWKNVSAHGLLLRAHKDPENLELCPMFFLLGPLERQCPSSAAHQSLGLSKQRPLGRLSQKMSINKAGKYTQASESQAVKRFIKISIELDSVFFVFRGWFSSVLKGPLFTNSGSKAGAAL